MESKNTEDNFNITPPALNLPKGGGAIRGMGEKFSANPVTGTGSMSVPIYVSPGRSGFNPELSISYDSGAGNGIFGFGWNLSLPAITRKTDKGLPRYLDAEESDTFILSGSEDLVPVSEREFAIDGQIYLIKQYRPRIEGLFARIERWTNTATQDTHWRSISKENIFSIYGANQNSRIANPDNPQQVFSWLLCETRDDKGNAILYEYKADDGTGVNLNQLHQRNRGDEAGNNRTANRFLKQIHYGNKKTLLVDGKRPIFLSEERRINTEWMFKVVLDYGEHDPDTPKPDDDTGWHYREDAFSSYRSGFEIRTSRLCQRVLMFHHFEDEPELVRSTNFNYSRKPTPSQKDSSFTFLNSTQQIGYKKSNTTTGYLSQQLPPLEFTYSAATISTQLQSLEPNSIENMPVGIDGANYRWVDLDGEGLSGILTEQANGWFYKHNESPLTTTLQEQQAPKSKAKFAPLKKVSKKPSLAFISGGNQQLLDLAGNGKLDLVAFDSQTPGYYERTHDEDWENFKTFESLPILNWQNPNLKMIDITGDGHADILISEDEVFCWYRSLAEKGFAPPENVRKVLDEEHGARIVFADSTQAISLADMSGDGLTDIVRIRNGEICYWPNLGYGRFGAKVTMDNAPHFDYPDQFNQQRIRLVDIDGSGVTDIIYLGREHLHLYFNQSGNSWSEVETITHFPKVDNLANVQALDLLGNGTACLVWSSPLPTNSGQAMKYIDLMGGQKPHLLTKTNNNLGTETHIQYLPSTYFYLKDKYAGKSWVTRLPFPVSCVEKVIVTDKWRKTRFASTYSYHHGYFDGTEREFRGFGRVEQVDTESYGEFTQGNANSPYITDDKTLHQPPVKTITWFHTGAFLDKERILSQFQQEYFQHENFTEHQLPEPYLADQNLSNDEWRQALRACKGMMLRQESYELDVDALENGEHKPVKLYSTAYHNCHIDKLQDQANNRHAVFLVTESEAITYHYELALNTETPITPDPRVAHTLNLNIDEYGNTLQAIAVVYPRKIPHTDDVLPEHINNKINEVQHQQQPHLIYTENHLTNHIGQIETANNDYPADYRLAAPCEVLTYELTGVQPDQQGYFSLTALQQYTFNDTYNTESTIPVHEIAYQQIAAHNTTQKRCVEQVRMLYFSDDLKTPLLFGEQSNQGLLYETYKLALTDSLLNDIFGDKLAADTEAYTALNTEAESGYLSGEQLTEKFSDLSTDQYWMRSGIAGFADDARDHFFLPEEYTDAFGNTTTLVYDPLDLYIQSGTDPVGNNVEITAFDYRVLAPTKLKDINDNISETTYDILGLPILSAIREKDAEGDNLQDINNESIHHPSHEQLRQFFVDAPFDNTHHLPQARNWLNNATSRFVYYFGDTRDDQGNIIWGEHPACACSIARETHTNDLPQNEVSKLQIAFEYSDGGGNVLVQKTQAEPEDDSTTLRWLANGKTILNNKGKPVKQYEPYFSSSEINSEAIPDHRFEEPKENGVTPVMYYDATGRVTRTEMPDGTLSRVEFSPWHVISYDANDTILEEQQHWLKKMESPSANEIEQTAANNTKHHANTPTRVYLDTLGREVISIEHNKAKDTQGNYTTDEYYPTFTKLDTEGKPLWIRDARHNLVMQYINPPVTNNQTDDPIDAFVPCYDIAGNLLFQHSMDAGDRWMMMDATGKAFYAWDYNQWQSESGEIKENRIYRTTYDALHRPLTQQFNVNDEGWKTIERFVYGEEKTNDKANNLRGQLYKHYDSSGLITNSSFDFKGNLQQAKRRLTQDATQAITDWENSVSPDDLLVAETFKQTTKYDALNRMVRQENWHPEQSLAPVYQPSYNQRGLLQAEVITVGGNTAKTPRTTTEAIKRISYNAKGQRTKLVYGNGTESHYLYDTQNYRLTSLKTIKTSSSGINAYQDLSYTYDPMGNITHIQDKANQEHYFKNSVISPACSYQYDALYRLIKATGRENAVQPTNTNIEVHFPNTAPNALQNYIEEYHYDAVGNILNVKHQANTSPWKRCYQYANDSNRLLATGNQANSTTSCPEHYIDTNTTPNLTNKYHYDVHGSMLNTVNVGIEHHLKWDYRDMVQTINLGGGGEAWYNYDVDKQRTRKLIKRIGGSTEERIYLGGVELYRKFDANKNIKEEIETYHLFLDEQRLLLIDNVITTENINGEALLYRYQYGNHLGSVALELNEAAAVISYEEYHPYGTTAYFAKNSVIRSEKKRYRYTGMEKDEESNLSYHSARYYLPWLGRWLSSDPLVMVDGVNIFAYTRNNPLKFFDHNGHDSHVIKNIYFDDKEGLTSVEEVTVDPIEKPVVEKVQRNTIQRTTDFFDKTGIMSDIGTGNIDKQLETGEGGKKLDQANKKNIKMLMDGTESILEYLVSEDADEVNSRLDMISDTLSAKSLLELPESLGDAHTDAKTERAIKKNIKENIKEDIKDSQRKIKKDQKKIKNTPKTKKGRKQIKNIKRSQKNKRESINNDKKLLEKNNAKRPSTIKNILNSKANGWAILGAVLNIKTMITSMYKDNKEVMHGRITRSQYYYRAIVHISSGVISIAIPYSDKAINYLGGEIEDQLFDKEIEKKR